MSTNERCNPLAAIIGLFCHSTSAPELVIEMLTHTGLSISLTSIHNMVDSLSQKSLQKLRELAKTQLVAFAYDNFDMDFKSSLPVIERAGSTLQHATSALAFPLMHSVVPDDLKCSAELWQSDSLNLWIPDSNKRPKRTWMDCLPIPDPSSLHLPSREIRTIAWHF
jgi:hypothetical protein